MVMHCIVLIASFITVFELTEESVSQETEELAEETEEELKGNVPIEVLSQRSHRSY